MLSKSTIKFIKSLQVKKYRKQEQCFVVEGAKSVQELMRSDFSIEKILGTEEFFQKHEAVGEFERILVTERELEGLGEFQTNNAALAVARMKLNLPPSIAADEFALVLDDIRDPGNLGTIIRTADWYGIKSIIASNETADFYNSKVITSTMGSFTRLGVYYTDLVQYLQQAALPILGTFLDGISVHEVTFGAGGFIVIGNEARGISQSLASMVTQKITIPRFGAAESLNAAVATAIICDNLRRPR